MYIYLELIWPLDLEVFQNISVLGMKSCIFRKGPYFLKGPYIWTTPCTCHIPIEHIRPNETKWYINKHPWGAPSCIASFIILSLWSHCMLVDPHLYLLHWQAPNFGSSSCWWLCSCDSCGSASATRPAPWPGSCKGGPSGDVGVTWDGLGRYLSIFLSIYIYIFIYICNPME